MNDITGRHHGELEGPGRPVGDTNDLAVLRELARNFVRERDWEKYHTPRSLILALMGEVGELAELFQWLTDQQASELTQDPKQRARVGEELADVFLYVLQLADTTGVNLGEALVAKMRLNEQRYPADLARGNALKYTQLGHEYPREGS